MEIDPNLGAGPLDGSLDSSPSSEASLTLNSICFWKVGKYGIL